MLKKFILCLLSCVYLTFGMSEAEISKFIQENSSDFAALKGVPSRVYASSPPLLYILYALAPEKISGVNFEWNDYERPYIKQNVLNEPVVGGFFGQGKIPNVEMLLRLDPELILVNLSSKNTKKMSEVFGSIKKPMLYLNALRLEDYLQSFEVLGKILGKEARANELIKYAQSSLNLSDEVENYIKNSGAKRARIYYAQGSDGLSTECAGSWHATLIERSGAQNVHTCSEDPNAKAFGRVKISFEQLVKYDPDIVLIYEKELFDKIYADPKWQLLSAVKNKKAYFIPREPFSWFDRPPSFMRFLGLKWLINLTYPEAFKFDMVKETREFYRLFLDIDLDENAAKKILGE
ncbi:MULTISPECIES: ABC transporter substrate-binding protein [Campylobacter]|uniref:ABC transporter substrate-binding protein n=1 Tax=Campylobacter TaxID=194 RepID=UPI00147086A6|nr:MULTISPECIES: ABC transporter substrate-binding protein [Campylobacter]MDU6828228.1 ABC transporter substrate-binding protein [Campylobacter sp.]